MLEPKCCERCGGPITPSTRDRKSQAVWRKRRFCSKSCASSRPPRGCSVPGCKGRHRGHGLCEKHGWRFSKTGTLESPRKSSADKLRSRCEPNGDCIEYTGGVYGNGYGYITEYRNNKRVRLLAHRAAVIMSGRILQPTDVVMHTCDNPPCINPEHLVIGTQQDNIRDALNKGRLNLDGLVIGQRLTRSGHSPKERARLAHA